MSSVDNRVVEMEFDNAGFETGVSQTIQSLDRLRESLKLDNIDTNVASIASAINGIDVSAANSAMNSIIDKFSVFGTIADQVLRNIGNSIFSVGRSLVNYLITPLTSGGWNRAMNIEQARFMIEGLEADWKALSEDINYGVLNTAYTFDAAAKAAAALVASGVKAGDQMRYYLRGISGIAAQTNSDYSSMADIFTTVAGNGKLMTMQLRQLSSRGMNAAAQLAKFINGVLDGEYQEVSDAVKKSVRAITNGAHVTEATINDLVSDGKINADVFAEAMDTLFGAHAADANKTYAGSLANIRAALSKIGQMFAAPIIQQMPDIFNAVRENINEIKTAMTPFIDDASDYNKAVKSIISTTGAWIKAGDFSWFEHIIEGTDQLVRLVAQLGYYLFFVGSAPVRNISLSRLFIGKESEFDWIAAFLEMFADRYETFIRLLTSYGNDMAFLNSLSEIGTGIATAFTVAFSALDLFATGIFDLVFPSVRALTSIIFDLGERAGRVLFNAFDTLLPLGRNLANVFRTITRTVGRAAANGLLGVFNRLTPSLMDLEMALLSVFEAFKDLGIMILGRFPRAFEELSRIFGSAENVVVDGIGSALSFLIDRVVDVVNAFSGLLQFLTENTAWLDAFTNIVGVAAIAFEWLTEHVSAAVDVFNALQESTTDITLDFSLQGLGRSGYNLLTAFAQTFGISQEYVDIFAEHVNMALEGIQNFVSSVSSWFGNLDFAGIWESIKTTAVDIFHTVTDEIVPAFQEGFGSGMSSLGDALIGVGRTIVTSVSGIFTSFVLPNLATVFGTIGEKIGGLIKGAFDRISSIFKGSGGNGIANPLEGLRSVVDGFLDFDFMAIFDTLGEYTSDIKIKVGDIAEAGGEVAENVSRIIRTFLYKIHWYDFVTFVDGILGIWARWNIGRFIGEIADVVDAAEGVVRSVSGLIGSIGSMFQSIGGMFKDIGKTFKAAAVLELAIALFLVVQSIIALGEYFQNTDPAVITSSVIAVVVIMASLYWLLTLINKTLDDSTSVAKDTKVEINVLGKIIGEIKAGLRGIAEGFRMAGVGAAIFLLAASVLILAAAAKVLSSVPLDKMVPAVLAVLAFMGVLKLLLDAVKGSGEAIGMAALGMLAIAIAVSIIVKAVVRIYNSLKQLEDSEDADLFQNAILMVLSLFAGLFTFAGIAIAASQAFGVSNDIVAPLLAAGAMIALIAFSVSFIAKALKTLKTTSPEQLAAEVEAMVNIVGIIGMVLVAIVGVTHSLGGNWSSILASGAMIALSIVMIKMLANTLADLSFVDAQALGTSVSSIITILLVVGAALAALVLFSGVIKQNWQGLAVAAVALIAISASLVVFAEALRLFSEMDDVWTSFGVATAALAVLVIALFGLAGIVYVFGDVIWVGVAAIGILVLALYVLGDALQSIADALNSYQDIGNAAENVGSVLSEIVQAFADWGSVGLGIAGITGGISDAAKALVDLSPVIEAFRNVGNAPTNIGKVVDGIVEGLKSTGVDNVFAGAQSLAAAADGLIALSPVLQAYSGDFGMIPSNIRAVCESIVNGVAGLTGKGEAGAVFNDVAQGLKTLASVLQSYARKNIEEIADNFKKVCEKIGEGMKSFGTPDQYAESFSKVAEGLKVMAPALAAYKEISAEDAQNICTIIQNIGAAFVGMEGIDNEAVSTTATSFASISDALQNFPTDVTPITSALGEVTGSLETFTGDTTDILSNFDLEALMEGSGISSESLFAFLGQGAGEAGNIAGGEYFAAFQQQIQGGLFGGGGSGFMGGAGSGMWQGGEDQARAAGESFGLAFAGGIDSSGVSEKVNEMVQSTGQTLAEGVSNIDAAQYGRQVVTDYMQGFHGNATSIAAAIYTIGLSVANGFEKAKSAFENAGRSAATALVNGMSIAGFALESKGRSMANAVISGLQNGASPRRAREVGYNFVQGFVNGVQNNSFLAFIAGRIVGERTLAGLKWGTRSNSPSRAAMEVGGYFTEGFVIGINKGTNSVEKSAFGLGTTADRALNEAIGTALSWFNDNNGDITITPVLDLSEIQAGSRTMQSMLGASTPMLAAGYGYSPAMLSGANNVASRGNAQSVTYQFDFGNAVLNNDADMQNAALNLLETLKRKADMYG